MTTAHTDHPSTKALEAQSQGCRVERTPFYFQSEGHSLFAWLHQAEGIGGSHGILICPPIGHEQVHSHRALRHLADALAAKGFAVMRMDYHGTGDSDGTDKDPNRLGTWQANVRDAAGWLRMLGGCDKVSLIGIRLGAALAARHAEEHEVENLVLWSPVIKGSRYVRELTALGLTATHSGETGSSMIEAVGFAVTDETAKDLAQIDLLKSAPQLKSGLIVLSDKGAQPTLLLDHLSKAGARIEQKALPGYEEMMAEPQSTEVPRTAIAAITEWMHAHAGAQAACSRVSEFGTTMTIGEAAGVRETLHRISSDPNLFGIATEPAAGPGHLPWIVMLNAGAANRIGPGRLHVQLARHLAALGYPCLRMDICGLGDSVTDCISSENDTYASTAMRDAAIVCDYLQTLQPNRPILLTGLCSGAYAAFQSAAQLPHPALIGAVLINPLTFFWKDGMTISASPTQQLQAWHYYWSIIFDPNNWRQLFSGKGTAGLKGALQRFMQRVFPRTAPSSDTSERTAKSGPRSEYSHPQKENLSADLTRVVAASRKLAMFVSENDPGHFLLMYRARRKATQLIRTGKLECFSINGADHTFSTEASREALTRSLTDYLHSQFGSVACAVKGTADERRSPPAAANCNLGTEALRAS